VLRASQRLGEVQLPPLIRCKYDALVPVGELRPHPKNRNKHPADQIDRLAKLIGGLGVRGAIVVSNQSGFIVKGHGTLLAEIKAGMTEVPVAYQDFDTPEQEYAFLQSDNAIADWAEIDMAGVNADLGDLGPDFDIDLLGFRDFVVEPADLPKLPDGEKSPFRQMAFIVTDAQSERISAALKRAKDAGEFSSTGNTNSNGNALDRIVNQWLEWSR
jgi:hypothetical protein